MIRQILTEIQSQGIRLPDPSKARKDGAGPAEGGTLAIAGHGVTFPVAGQAMAHSPFSLEPGEPAMLLKNGQPVLEVQLLPRPLFYSQSSSDGVPLNQIALLHGTDCLATTVRQECRHWNTPRQCLFCGIGLSLKNGGTIARKTPEQLAQAATAALCLDHVRHVVLTTGDFADWREGLHAMAACTRAIKEASALAVHVQVAPPPDPDALEILQDAGVDTMGIHIESMDPDILAKAAPAKAALGQARYEASWKKAVKLFGPNQVSSFLLAGLGENPESLVEGARVLAGMGVFPLPVPLRPIPGSKMADALPPSAESMARIYEPISRILAQNRLSSKSSKAGCVRCGACSALWAFEE